MTEETTLYRLYGADRGLLYVGITGRALKRMYEHGESKSWWPNGAEIHIEHFPSRDEALTAEERAIKTQHPIHNKVHARSGEQFHLPPRLTLDQLETIRNWILLADGTQQKEMCDAQIRDTFGLINREIQSLRGHIGDMAWFTLLAGRGQSASSLVDQRTKLIDSLDKLETKIAANGNDPYPDQARRRDAWRLKVAQLTQLIEQRPKLVADAAEHEAQRQAQAHRREQSVRARRRFELAR